MYTKNYESPLVEVVEVCVEQGFALSGETDNLPIEPASLDW